MLLTGAANKDREGKKDREADKDREGKEDREGRQRQGRQKDREDRQRQRRQERQAGLFRDVRTSQRQAGSYRTKNQPKIRQVGTLDCYSTCQCPALLKWCLCSMERGPCPSRIFFQNHDLCLNRITAERWKVRHLPVGCGLVGTVV